ncbi:histidine kinase, partial [Fulvivirga lutimaris]|uniref:histidine kinase n=1 Tax=Fulvivirga lutimaris TaxID=1819566 RepID=UPI001627EF26|nr:hypothetical protein [Fulvivirga lutimaris]
MKIVPPYRPLPISKSKVAIGLATLSLIVWLQGTTTSAVIHGLFLFSNYLIWFMILPWVNGWVFESRFDSVNGAIRSVIVVALIIAAHWILSNMLFYTSKYLLFETQVIPSAEELSVILLPSILNRFVDLALFFGLLSWAHQNNQVAEQRLKVIEQEGDLQRSKLQALKNQLNPHFLFNTLNTVSSLIGVDDEKAQKLTIQISHLLRKMLVINESNEHSLREEWAFVRDYLNIEAERFHDRLTIVENIDDSLMDLSVPTMILQPLIENAFKHGISQSTIPTTLIIDIGADREIIVISVTNDLANHNNVNFETKTGVGINNLADRLDTYY